MDKEIYVVGLVGFKAEKGRIFKVKVKETEKTFSVIHTPYQFFKLVLRKADMYKPFGYRVDYMYGVDKEELIKAWKEYINNSTSIEIERHKTEMSRLTAMAEIEEEC